jgi:hypothetical protein
MNDASQHSFEVFETFGSGAWFWSQGKSHS